MPASNCSWSSSNMRETERGGEQTRRFRREINTRGIGRSDHRRQPFQRRRRETKFLDHDVESAEFTSMAPEDILDVERCCGEPFADSFDFRWRDEEKHRRGIDKAAY